MSKWKCKNEKCTEPFYVKVLKCLKPRKKCVWDEREPDCLEETEPVTNYNQLQKLTSEVFDRPDCPKWAKYAAVDEDGIAFYYQYTPFATREKWYSASAHYQKLIGKWDASDWLNSLIELTETRKELNMNKTCGECETFSDCYPLQEKKYPSCHEFKQKQTKPTTNGDVIRQMSNGVLAYMITRLILEGCPISKSKTLHGCKISNDCTNCLKQWLDAPAERNEEDK